MIGFDKIRESLRGASKQGTLAHSHILAGPDGIGKSPMAKSLAGLILRPDSTVERSYVDIIEVRPSGKSIGVDEVRRIIGEANIMPFEGNRKVIIIYNGELMTTQAQNGLLKTIEEPQPGVYFIILTKTLDNLLPTIRSRCAIHRLAPLSRAEISQYIGTVHGLTGAAQAEATAISLGIPGQADAFLNSPETRLFYDDVTTFLDNLAQVKSLKDRSCLPILIKNQAILSYGPQRFLEVVLLAVRDLACLKTYKDYKTIIFLYNRDKMVALSQKYTMARLSRIVDVCESAARLLEPGRNINRETVVDGTLFKLVEET
ncbi:MAG: AAA family ATPase [Clostridiaceae bacterium]